MAHPPVSNESISSSASRMVGELATVGFERPVADIRVSVGKPGRELCFYPARMGYDLQEELDFLSHRSMEANVFFSGRFLAPAMPRLEDRQIRLALIRDAAAARSRMRLLMPFSIEKPGFSVGPSIIRSWANPFGPLGTPLVDAEGAAETIDNLFEGLMSGSARLPHILVFPDVRLDGRFVHLAKAVALARDLPVTVTNTYERPILESALEGPDYLAETMARAHRKEMRRQWRLLEDIGTVEYSVSRQPAEVRGRMEEFLALEASGWKGRKRTAITVDRYRAAFAREAITNLAEADAVRIHTIDVDGKAIASIVVFIMAGEAYTWKIAFNEDFARFSPGKLLFARLTEWHLDDANINRTDSCAVPDHPLAGRLWAERESMGTLMIGLGQNADRDVRQAAAQLHMYSNTRNMARTLRNKILSLAGRG
ncbi:GNAT family N-acetyltransferase [Ferirhizobium litorale]